MTVGQAQFDPDGTQSPPPPPAFNDPLAGLVTGSDAGIGARATPDDEVEVEIASPVEPDPEVVRDMVDAALTSERDEELFSRLRGEDRKNKQQEPAQPAESGTTESGAQAPTPTAGMLPAQQQRAWPGQPQLMQAFRPRHRDEREPKPQPVRKPSSGSAGLGIAVVLLVIFGVLVIQLLSSLFDSFSGVFN
ncbi:hypothetical protein GCM10027521_50020 [Amycolatopsis cihanbeyliensis]